MNRLKILREEKNLTKTALYLKSAVLLNKEQKWTL